MLIPKINTISKGLNYLASGPNKLFGVQNKIALTIDDFLLIQRAPTKAEKRYFLLKFKDNMTENELEHFFNFAKKKGIKDVNESNINKLAKDYVKQLTSQLRGVTAKNEKEAKKFLTETEYGRSAYGGDMLRTRGGLYTSNSPDIGNSFSKSVGSSIGGKLSYVGLLETDIPSNLEGLDLIKWYNKSFLNIGFTPHNYNNQYLKELAKQGVKAVETPYGGEATQRAFLPNYDVLGSTLPVKISKLITSKDVSDAGGRWGLNASVSPELFSAKPLLRSDFGIHWKAFNNMKKPLLGTSGNMVVSNLGSVGILTIPTATAMNYGIDYFFPRNPHTPFVMQDGLLVENPEYKKWVQEHK